MVHFNSEGPARDRVLRLMEQKDRIESEIRDQNLILETENVGMDEPLVDEQGFPRSDIDVYKVRHARHRIICLQNDHKSLMRRIEQGLAEVHALFLPHQGASGGATTSHMNGHANGHLRTPTESTANITNNEQGFATITFVQNGSPADVGGLSANDEVLQFGSVTTGNFTDITQINDVVAHSVGQSVRVVVRRSGQVVCLSVTPRPWEQPGLLGCQVVRRPN